MPEWADAWLGGFLTAAGAATFVLVRVGLRRVGRWLRNELGEEIDQRVTPHLEKIHRRVDEHMDREEDSLNTLAEEQRAIRQHIDTLVEERRLLVNANDLEHRAFDERLRTLEKTRPPEVDR